MATPSHVLDERHIEVERLIGLARAMLTDLSEQLIVDYLDHAAAALRELPSPAFSEQDRAPEPNHD